MLSRGWRCDGVPCEILEGCRSDIVHRAPYSVLGLGRIPSAFFRGDQTTAPVAGFMIRRNTSLPRVSVEGIPEQFNHAPVSRRRSPVSQRKGLQHVYETPPASPSRRCVPSLPSHRSQLARLLCVGAVWRVKESFSWGRGISGIKIVPKGAGPLCTALQNRKLWGCG